MDYKKITELPLFRGFTQKEIELLFSSISFFMKEYEKGEMIVCEEEPALWIGCLLEGEVLVCKNDYEGRRNILFPLSAPRVFGESVACLDIATMPVSICADSHCTVLLLDRKSLLCDAPLDFSARINANLLTILARKNLVFRRKIDILSEKTTRKKILSYLEGVAMDTGSREFRIAFNRQELADYLCVERSALSSEIGKLVKEGVLETRRNFFKLL